MKKRKITAIVLMVAAAALAGAATACASRKDEEAPYAVIVTFNYNSAHITSDTCPTQYLGLKNKGDLAVAPGSEGIAADLKKGTLADYYLEGWYEPLLDEEGLPLDVDGDHFRPDANGSAVKTDKEGFLLAADGETYLKTEHDSRIRLSDQAIFSQEYDGKPFKLNGRMLITESNEAVLDPDREPVYVTFVEVQVDLEKPWDFAHHRVEENITLYGHFIPAPEVHFYDEKGDTALFYTNDPNSPAEFVLRGNPGAKVLMDTEHTPVRENSTFYGYYADETSAAERSKTQLDWSSLTYPSADTIIDHERFPETKVYLAYVEGSWEIVRTADGLNAALGGNRSVWLDNNIEFTDTVKFSAANCSRAYTGEFNGNGHTVSGINVAPVQTGAFVPNTGCGIFGRLTATAYVHDVTFENVSITFSTKSESSSTLYAGLFAGYAEAGARIARVTVTGTLTIGNIEKPECFEAHAFIGNNRGAMIEEESTHYDDITLVDPSGYGAADN